MPSHRFKLLFDALRLVVLLVVAIALAPQIDVVPVQSPTHQKSVIGTPMIDEGSPLGPPGGWGPEVAGARLYLSLRKSKLYYGEPLDISLDATQFGVEGPYVRLFNSYDPAFRIELTTEDGKAVPFHLRMRNGLRLEPREPFALGRYFISGKYRVRATFNSVWNPRDPQAWIGQLTSPRIRFHVVDKVETTRDDSDEQATSEESRTIAAAYGPVDAYQDLSHPTLEQVSVAVARIQHKDPSVRIRAIRGLSRTTNTAIISALVRRLNDPFVFWDGYVDPYQSPLVSNEAAEALVWQGPEVIGPLVAFGRDPANKSARSHVIRVLGELPPDPRSVAFLGEVLATHEHTTCCDALQALPKLGHAAEPLLLRTARDKLANGIIRRMALEGLGQVGTAENAGALLVEMLEEANHALAREAATAAGKLGVRAALPALTRIARSESIDQNARYAALWAVVLMGEPKEVDSLLIVLLDKKRNNGVRGMAMSQLAQRRPERVLPHLLDALDDTDWYVRATADTALRGLSGLSTGVGYDPQKPDARKWRNWWKR